MIRTKCQSAGFIDYSYDVIAVPFTLSPVDMTEIFANSVEPDQIPMSDLGLFSLFGTVCLNS